MQQKSTSANRSLIPLLSSTALVRSALDFARSSAVAVAVLGTVMVAPTRAAESPASSCTNPDSKRCTVDLSTGVRMAYLEVGPASGPTVILLHGLTDSVRSWSLAMSALHGLAPEVHIYALDLRGHGQTSMPPDSCAAAPEACYAIADMAEDVRAFMASMKIGHATVVGHSMGSVVTQDLALAHPELVDHAILVSTTASSVGNAALTDYVLKEPLEGTWKAALVAKGHAYPKDFYHLKPLDADPKAPAWIAQNWDVDPLAPADFLKPYIPETAHLDLGTWIGATKALLKTDNTKRLEGLSVPTLILWASQDNIFLPRDQDDMKTSLKKAAAARSMTFYWKQYGVTPLPASGSQESDIGHNIQWAAPHAVADDILAFMRTGKPTKTLPKAVKAASGWSVVEEKDAATIVELSH